MQKLVRDDIALMLVDAQDAVTGITKNSRLRSHYLKLVMMNNIMRAFIVNYDLTPEFKAAQEALLETLKRVEARKNRQWLTPDKIAVQEAFNAFTELLQSCEEDQLCEIMQYVDANKDNNRWIVTSRK